MTTTATSRSPRTRTRAPQTFPVVLGLVCLLGGASLAFTAIGHITDLGVNAPYMHNLMAFNEPATAQLTDVLGPAAKSVDNLTLFVTIAAIATAATLLIVAAGLFLSSGHVRHPDAARRVAAVGLWLALGIAVINVIPFDAGWGEAALGTPGGSVAEGIRTGLVALGGLLVLQISAPQWRHSVRDAFRD
ncbi:MAG: hypothetical protein U0R64_09165 [Candidatus Nanopelagicales bacterium]